ncbi:hypothetical protein [Leptospira idonii]|uniref:Uncharacterized protein n=1 Tax=Leptospira idonii TaxID=1193500 RepID=A0A4R9LV99_9LEPT|nr:hypothetical protein [Leptospira idonii]TGN18163.1 hypothetical protein EHS15_12160 [Leptospira idonii]
MSSMEIQNPPEEYQLFLKEVNFSLKFTQFRKSLSLCFLALYLYLLFSSKYTASPLIVLINYLAIYTSFSGLIAYKFFEIPKLLLDVGKTGDASSFFHLSSVWRQKVLENTLKRKNIFPLPENLSEMKSEEIISLLALKDRLNWIRIGWIYLGKYVLTVGIACSYLFYIYWKTGFSRDG